ncbi:MAG: 16S rRNA (guanine(527)-N(7))-methyltransferase RsmG [Gallionella sp.]
MKLDELSAGAQQLGISLSPEQNRLLSAYLALLHKWNKVYNLTAIRDPQQMIVHHLLDSLAVLPHLWAGRWLDVGCGAGLPGMVLAVMRPDYSFTLLDSNSKKTGFVQQAVIELGLQNVTVRCARVEDLHGELFDGIISRAFTELGDFIQISQHLLADGGRWAAMKGVAEKELHAVPAVYCVEAVHVLQVPGLAAARSLVVVSKRKGDAV